MSKKVKTAKRRWLRGFSLIGMVVIGAAAAPLISKFASLYEEKPGSQMAVYQTAHFIIHSDFDARYVKFLQSNLEPFYDEMTAGFFTVGWDKPLDIYYSKSQADTKKLLANFGYNEDVGYGIYIHKLKAIFSHREMTAGGFSGLGTLYHEIIHHFVDINYGTPPTWFNEGLATFLGEEVRFVNGKLTLGCPNPWREYILRQMLESGFEIDINNLTSLTSWQFYNDSSNYHPARALFYWMYENGHLSEYMKNAKSQGYDIEVLERTVARRSSQINSELTAFIKSNCYPAALFQAGRRTGNIRDKKAFFQQSLCIKPDYYPAVIELARCFYDEKDYQRCKDILSPVLKEPHCKDYAPANEMIAKIYFAQNDFTNAMTHYTIAWESSVHYEYRYLHAYMIGNCCHELGDFAKAKYWYDLFLTENWEPEKDPQSVSYAQTYKPAPKPATP